MLLVSHALISGGIFLVSRLHLISALETSCGFAKPASSVINATFKEIPFRASVIFRNAVEKFVRFRNAVLLNKPANVSKLAVLGIAASVIVITAVSAVISVTGTSVRSFSGFAVFLNLFISGVDVFHLFRGNVRKGVVNIFIRMIFSNKFTVSFFDFLVGGVFRNAENSVRIIRFVLPLSYRLSV